MTTLVVQRLYSELSQEVTFYLTERVHIASIAPYLYINGNTPGTFTFSMEGTSGVIFSESFTVADIKTDMETTDSYIHVFYPVIPTNPTHIEAGSFTFKLTASGYSPTQNFFIGWVQQHEDIQNTIGYISTSDETNPLALRYKGYKEGIL